MASEQSAPVSSVKLETSNAPACRPTHPDSYGRSEAKEKEKYPQDTQSSNMVKLSKATVLSQGNEALCLQQQQKERGPIEPTGQLPRHLQKMIDAFYVVNILSAKNGPCSPTLKDSEFEMDNLVKSNIIVHGRTAEPLQARRYWVRKGKYVLVVSGPGLSKSSIIRCLPRETGVQDITAWAVWKGLEGMERKFLIFKVVGTTFKLCGKGRKGLLTLQNSFKAQKRDPFVLPKVKFTRNKLAKQVLAASKSKEGREVDMTNKLPQPDRRNLPDLQAGDLEELTKKNGGFKRHLIDLSGDDVLEGVTIPVMSGNTASASILEPIADLTNVASRVAESSASSSPGDAITKLGCPPSVDLLPLHQRENTYFSFVNDSDEINERDDSAHAIALESYSCRQRLVASCKSRMKKQHFLWSCQVRRGWLSQIRMTRASKS
jgi:hypothetical protein